MFENPSIQYSASKYNALQDTPCLHVFFPTNEFQPHRTKTVLAAKGEAESIKKVGGAEATAIEAIGKAEAERMRMKAAAYKQYGDAAMMSLVLDALPKVCMVDF